MEWDHDEWIKQLREFLAEDGKELSDEDLMWVSNLAAKVARGEVTIHEAHHMFQEKIAAEMGYVHMDKELFEMEVDLSELIDVTEGVKDNLIRCGQPGLSDAILEMHAHPDITEDMNTRTDDQSKQGKAAVAVKSKGWFQVAGMHPEEHRLMGWAVGQAVRDHVATN